MKIFSALRFTIAGVLILPATAALQAANVDYPQNQAQTGGGVVSVMANQMGATVTFLKVTVPDLLKQSNVKAGHSGYDIMRVNDH